MKILIKILAAVSFLAIPYTVCAHEGLYIGGMAGASSLNVSHDKHKTDKANIGPTVGASVGYKFDNGFSTEAEVSYRKNHFKKFHRQARSQSLSLMANGFYDIPVGAEIIPYVGAGLGYDVRDSKEKPRRSGSGPDIKGGLAWQVMAGANYALSKNVQANLEYKHHRAKNNNSNAVTMGLKRFF